MYPSGPSWVHEYLVTYEQVSDIDYNSTLPMTACGSKKTNEFGPIRTTSPVEIVNLSETIGIVLRRRKAGIKGHEGFFSRIETMVRRGEGKVFLYHILL